MTIDQRTFRHTMGQFVTGVTVVTTHEDERPIGITVSSFASLSLDPPLVLICIDSKGRSHNTISDAKMFAVNVLTDHQEQLARTFASRAADKFADIPFTWSAHHLPLLNEVLATIECRLVNTLPGGDHTIFVGEVIGLETYEGQPLVYHSAQFGQFTIAPSVTECSYTRNQVRTAELVVA